MIDRNVYRAAARALVVAGLSTAGAGTVAAQSCYGTSDATVDLGMRDIDRNCAQRFDVDRCYEAARVYVAIVKADRYVCPGTDPRRVRETVATAQQVMRDMKRKSSGVAARNAAAGREYNRPRGGGGSAGGYVAPAPSYNYAPPSSPAYTPPTYTCAPGYLVNGHQCY